MRLCRKHGIIGQTREWQPERLRSLPKQTDKFGSAAFLASILLTEERVTPRLSL